MPCSCGGDDRDLSRRQFVAQGAAALGGAMALGRLASAQQRKEDQLERLPDAPARAVEDPTILVENAAFQSGGRDIEAIIARPKSSGRRAAVLVIPGNWLIEPYIAEISAMLAQAGFVGIAIDPYPQFPRKATWEEAQAVPAEETQKILREQWTDAGFLQEMADARAWALKLPFVTGERVALLGFCGGGWNSILFAADHPDAAFAVVAFYAPPDAAKRFDRPRSVLDVIERLSTPTQFHYGTRDGNIPMADVERLRGRLATLKVRTDVHVYEGADHGFLAFNRTQRYEPEAAAQAWDRAVEWLARRAPPFRP